MYSLNNIVQAISSTNSGANWQSSGDFCLAAAQTLYFLILHTQAMKAHCTEKAAMDITTTIL